MGPEKAGQPARPDPYLGFRDDLALLHETVAIRAPGAPEIRASSSRALLAAGRVFRGFGFVGLRREAVLSLLGDPRLSDLSPPQPTGPEGNLLYRFDTGYSGGAQYTVVFSRDRVTRVEYSSLSASLAANSAGSEVLQSAKP